MVDKTLSTIVGGGGELAPTSLDFVVVNNTSSYDGKVDVQFGAKVSAPITSATLAEVVNISGRGYFTYINLFNSSSNTLDSPKVRIVIDGVTVLDVSSGPNITTTQHMAIVGIFNDQTSLNLSTEPKIHFKESAVISIASDGIDAARLGFKRVLT